MYGFILHAHTRPERAEAFEQLFRAYVEPSRAEPGCEDYCFSVELNDPGVLRITERWRDMAALIAHFATPHMATFGAALGAHPPKSVEARCYEANEVPLPGR